MATIVLSAAGMALGGSVGGTVLGMSMAVVGQAAGAALGRVIDQRILGAGSDPVAVGRVDRFRLTTASEGTAVGRVFGRMRVSGQVIWATRFSESTKTMGGGKGSKPQPKTTEYSYSVSLAIALCEGEITRIGRIWADGVEIAPDTLNICLYQGSMDQEPDPKIIAIEGVDNAPAYRGIAYLVMEDLDLGQFGNRVPQFTFEVMRPAAKDSVDALSDLAHKVRAVAIIPGTGEYALGTTPAYLSGDVGETVAINVNTPSGGTDFATSIEALDESLPSCGSGLLVVSWFGSDLRCGTCVIEPKVEQTTVDAKDQPWVVAGQARAGASVVAQVEGRPVYGGTPCDASVIEAIVAMKDRGIEPVFYPFILMEQLEGNGLPDPYSNAGDQPVLPWRGRITLDKVAGQAGSVDQTAAAQSQVDAFMGMASASDFSVQNGEVTYSGPQEWRYKRFILHYAALCAAAGGVSAFCIGSEMRGLTQIRAEAGRFPAVEALIDLAADVRSILGPDTKISYAADWSEYHGYQPSGTADKLFHLDALWADTNIDFIGIDNYMPLSDWRDGADHADAAVGSIYDLDYLAGNVVGGEGFDWYYASGAARDDQNRTPITDGEGEPWVWRYKDLQGWWSHAHHNRIGGVRDVLPTAWVPQSKPFWFTELGCAAIDKGTNQPNKFLDPKSSESQLPHYSNGLRDDLMQMQYLRAIYRHFGDVVGNPISTVYAASMVTMERAHVWAWDARPFPAFPATSDLWSDGENYDRGHWLNGRESARTLASVVAEICTQSGVLDVDVSRLYGVVRGYIVSDITTARAALQPLLMAYGVDVAETNGKLVFRNRDGASVAVLGPDDLAYHPEKMADVTRSRAAAVEVSGRVQVGYIEAERSFEMRVAETMHPTDNSLNVSRSELPLVLTPSEGVQTADRWAHEARTAKDSVSFALPPSQAALEPGDTVSLDEEFYRIDRIEEAGIRLVDAVRVTPEVYVSSHRSDVASAVRTFLAPVPVEAAFLDLPLLSDTEDQKPLVALAARPWQGAVAVYGSSQDQGYDLQDVVREKSTMGRLHAPLKRSRLGLWDRQAEVTIKLIDGAFASFDKDAVLNGANSLAIGDGTAGNWEIVQFLNAEPIDARTFKITGLLRGQLGSDCCMLDEWPVGSEVVVLDGSPSEVTVPQLARDTERYFRYGPAKRPLDDASYQLDHATFEGNTLRPYSVCHLTRDADGLAFDWVRRARVGGDVWAQTDVPLAEESERYVVQVRVGATVVREVYVTEPSWTYDVVEQVGDVGSSSYDVAVAQVSARYGIGPFRVVKVDQ